MVKVAIFVIHNLHNKNVKIIFYNNTKIPFVSSTLSSPVCTVVFPRSHTMGNDVISLTTNGMCACVVLGSKLFWVLTSKIVKYQRIPHKQRMEALLEEVWFQVALKSERYSGREDISALDNPLNLYAQLFSTEHTRRMKWIASGSKWQWHYHCILASYF